LQIPHVWGAILGFDAQMSVFWSGRGPVYEDLYPQAPEPGSVPNCATAGVLGALAGVVGTSMALETLKVLTGVGTPLMGEVGYYSGLEGRWEYIPLLAGDSDGQEKESTPITVSESEANNAEETSRESVINSHNSKSDAVLSGEKGVREVDFEQVKKELEEGSVYLLDVRELHEHEAVSIPGSHHWALSEIRSLSGKGALKGDIPRHLGDGGNQVLVYCAGGVRSLEAAHLLSEVADGEFYSLRGGINSWFENA
jgi:adenylyltransferase/sulfurtransferase